MAKGKGKSKGKKEQSSKDYEKFYETWLEFSKNINERIVKLTREGTREYEELYRIWSEYAKKMTEKLAAASPEDSKTFKDMQNMWSEYSDKIGERFVDLMSKDDGPYRELYQLYSDYSRKMGESLSEIMSGRIKEQKDLYELWMDDFGMNDKSQMENMGKFWLEMWERSKDILSSSGEEDYAAKLRELNELWTRTYSNMVMNFLRSQEFAEMNGTVLDRNLEMMRLNEGFMNQYLSAAGLPTKEGINDIYRKLHEIDRKVSKLSRAVRTSKSAAKK